MARFFCREIDNDDSDGEFIEDDSAGEAAERYAERCDEQSGERAEERRVSVCNDSEVVLRFVVVRSYVAIASGPEVATRADRIEAAARALLADIADPKGSPVVNCDRYGCDDLAMANGHVAELCDIHAAEYADPCHDRSYAPAVRALRAALAEVP